MQSAPGSIGQVREAATQLLFAAKAQNIPTFLVGHVTKEGSLAGPKALEHIVDTVLYFEGERHHAHRIVRAAKNRFGAVSELGVFEMTVGGPAARSPTRPRCSWPSGPPAAPGSAVLCCGRGLAPDARRGAGAGQHQLATATRKRTAVGLDQNRLSLLLAVLEKRAGLHLGGDDVYVNLAGGVSVEEPAADLAVVAAVASSVRNRAVAAGTAVFGEVGLAGEVRAVSHAARRVREAAQMGFTRCVMPAANVDPTRSRARGHAVRAGRCQERPGGARSSSCLIRPGRRYSAVIHGGPMAWFILVRLLFVVGVTYTAAVVHPLPGGVAVNAAFGAGLARPSPSRSSGA